MGRDPSLAVGAIIRGESGLMASSAAPAAFSSTSCQVCAGRPAIPGLITVCRRSSCWRRRWCYEVQIGHFKAKAEDSLYDSPESRLIGTSARRVVVAGPTRTSQSSNSARRVEPARPAKVISYVCSPTRNTPRSPPTRHATPRPGGLCERTPRARSYLTTNSGRLSCHCPRSAAYFHPSQGDERQAPKERD